MYNAGFSIKLGHSQTFSASNLTKLTNNYLLMTTEADVYMYTRTELHVVPNTPESRLEMPVGIVAWRRDERQLVRRSAEEYQDLVATVMVETRVGR